MQPSWTWAALGASLILALALRLACAGYSPWFDEWMSAWFASRPLAQLWGPWMVRETNPPLYYSLLKAWTALFGPQALAMRSLSVLGGVASIAALAACAQVAAGRRAAMIAALLAALSAQHVFYGTQIRGYIFAELAFALSLLGLLLLFRQDRTNRQLAAAAATYALGAAAAIYCHTTMVLWPVAATLTAFGMAALRQCAPRQLAWLIAAGAATAVIAAWWLYVTALQLQAGASNVSWIPAISLKAYLSMLRQSVFLVWNNTGAFKAASYGVVLLSVVGAFGKSRPVALLLIALLLASAAVFFIASLFKPIILARTLFWMSGLVVVLLSVSLAGARPGWLQGLAVGSLACLLLADLGLARGSYQTEDWRGYIRFQAGKPPATVLVDGPSNAIVVREACETELSATCPVRFAAIAHGGQSFDTGDTGGPPPLTLKPGERLPLSGPVYLLDTAGGPASSLFSLPAGVPWRDFAGLKLRGPVAAEQAIAR